MEEIREKTADEKIEEMKYASVPVLFAGIVLPAVVMITPFVASLFIGKKGRKLLSKGVKKLIG